MSSFRLKSDEINEIMGAKMDALFSNITLSLLCTVMMQNWNLLKAQEATGQWFWYSDYTWSYVLVEKQINIT